MRRDSVMCFLLATVVLACSSNPRPGESGFPYNVDGPYAAVFDIDGTIYEGTVQLATAEGGAVSGALALVSPVTINGTLEGVVLNNSFAFTSPYEIEENGCSGVVAGRGVIADGGVSVTGTADVDDDCGGALAGTFTLTR